MGDSWDKLPSPMEDGGDDYGCEYLHDVSWLRALNLTNFKLIVWIS